MSLNTKPIAFVAAIIAAIAIWMMHPYSHKNKPDSPYIAFSLRQARIMLENHHAGKDVDDLGGITRIAGIVYDNDPAMRDVILIGRHSDGDAPLTLSSLATAMRSLMLMHEWPYVSIDPRQETVYMPAPPPGDRLADAARVPDVDQVSTEQDKLQTVRLASCLLDTEFGASILDADASLKRTALLTNENNWGGTSYFDRCASSLRKDTGEADILSRFWFVPREPTVAARDNVFAITHLGVGVSVQVLRNTRATPGTTPTDPDGQAFADELSNRYESIARVSPSVGKLVGLLSLVAAATGIQSIPSWPDRHYWLSQFQVHRVSTPRTYPTLVRRKTINAAGRQLMVELEGGEVRLHAQLVRLRDGDVTALREIVLDSRPRSDALTWRLPVDDWHMAGTIAAPDDAAAQPQRDPANAGCSIASHITPVNIHEMETAGLPPPPLAYSPPMIHMVGSLSLGRPPAPSFSPASDDGLNIITSTTGPGKRGGRGGGTTRPPGWPQPPGPQGRPWPGQQPPLGGQPPNGRPPNGGQPSGGPPFRPKQSDGDSLPGRGGVYMDPKIGAPQSTRDYNPETVRNLVTSRPSPRSLVWGGQQP